METPEKHNHQCDCGKESCDCQKGADGCGCGHDHGTTKATKVTPRKPNTSGIAGDGDVVRIHYRGTLDDGEEFDSSMGREPIEFVLGEHTVIKGFEMGVTGMKVGEKKKITIESKDAYGDINPEMRQEIPREALGEIVPEEGMMLALNHPMAEQPIPVKVAAVTEKTVTIDMNHPLAGKTLHFDLELVEIR